MLPAIRSIRVALRDVTPSFHPSEYQFSKVSGYNCPSTLCASFSLTNVSHDYRYHNQVTVEYDVNESVMHEKIPKNILQPLMENAYYHGLATDSGEIKGNIEILVYPLEDSLVIEVSDNGKGFSEERLKEIRENLLHTTLHKKKEAHIGMENIYRRISYLYGDDFTMDIQSQPGHGSVIILTFPLDCAR